MKFQSWLLNENENDLEQIILQYLQSHDESEIGQMIKDLGLDHEKLRSLISL